MIKSYIRNEQGGAKPDEVRPPDMLFKTVKYLVDQIVDTDIMLNTKYKLPLGSNNKKRMNTFTEVYDFINDRFKACRQDLTIIFDKIEIDQMVISALEFMIRFYIIALYEGNALITKFDEQYPYNEMKTLLEFIL